MLTNNQKSKYIQFYHSRNQKICICIVLDSFNMLLFVFLKKRWIWTCQTTSSYWAMQNPHVYVFLENQLRKTLGHLEDKEWSVWVTGGVPATSTVKAAVTHYQLLNSRERREQGLRKCESNPPSVCLLLVKCASLCVTLCNSAVLLLLVWCVSAQALLVGPENVSIHDLFSECAVWMLVSNYNPSI